MSTQQYYTDDCTIPVPTGFRDRSTNVLEWKTEDGDSIALVIHRDQLPCTIRRSARPDRSSNSTSPARPRDTPRSSPVSTWSATT